MVKGDIIPEALILNPTSITSEPIFLRVIAENF
jgi:hypothetical protein